MSAFSNSLMTMLYSQCYYVLDFFTLTAEDSIPLFDVAILSDDLFFDCLINNVL